jgi:hypothetical protein
MRRKRCERNGAAGAAAAQWSERKRGAGGHRREAAAPSAKNDWRLNDLTGGAASNRWNWD